MLLREHRFTFDVAPGNVIELVVRSQRSQPATLSGPVTLRVVDTVRTPGSDGYDWVWLDWLAVRSTSF